MILQFLPGERKALTGWQYFWGWYVTGFNPRHHCQKCLLGWRSDLIRNGLPVGKTSLVLAEREPFDYFYLCGGAEDWDYKKNFHLAVRPRDGWDTKAVCYTGQKILIRNSEFIEIPEVPEGFDGKGPKFTTCRNYRFGVHAYMLDEAGQIRQPGPWGMYGVQPEDATALTYHPRKTPPQNRLRF